MTRIPNELRAGLVTAAFTFVGLFAMSGIGWLGDVAEWANTGGEVAFPSVSVLAYGAASAATAALSGALNALYRWAQTKVGAGSVPVYEPVEVVHR